MNVGNLLSIAVMSILINNFVLGRFLGLCPYVGVSKKLDSAFGMGLAVTFVMSLASVFTWLVYTYLLSPETGIWGVDLTYLKTISFILVIASLVQFVEMVIQKNSPTLYNALGIYLPLITTNCAVLGVSVLNIKEGYGFIESLAQGFSAGLGFTLVLILMAGMRERFELLDIPECLKGMPITLITAGLMALAFAGFNKLTLPF